jgi:hypothetical protein
MTDPDFDLHRSTPTALQLAAYAEHRLRGTERQFVEWWLLRHPVFREDVLHARLAWREGDRGRASPVACRLCPTRQACRAAKRGSVAKSALPSEADGSHLECNTCATRNAALVRRLQWIASQLDSELLCLSADSA